MVRRAVSIETYQNTIFGHFCNKKRGKVLAGCKDQPKTKFSSTNIFKGKKYAAIRIRKTLDNQIAHRGSWGLPDQDDECD